MENCRVISTLSLPLFAVQRCGADRWLVRAPDSDPYGPAVRLVAMVDDAAYAELSKPSEAVPPATYRSVAPNLFDRIIEQTISGSASLPLPRNATAGSGGADDGAAWCPPLKQAGG